MSSASLGYKVPMGDVGSVGMHAVAAGDWWLEPDQWVARLVDQLAAAWPLVAPHSVSVLAEMSRG